MFAQLLPGVLITMLTLLVSHLATWQYRQKLPRIVTYIIGCACIAAGMTVTAIISGDWTPILVYAANVLPGGAVVMVLWYGRLQSAIREEAAKDAAGIEEVARRHERTY